MDRLNRSWSHITSLISCLVRSIDIFEAMWNIYSIMLRLFVELLVIYFYMFFFEDLLNLYTPLAFNYLFCFLAALLEKNLLGLLLPDNGMTSRFDFNIVSSYRNFLLLL